jgi:hypothetical protein
MGVPPMNVSRALVSLRAKDLIEPVEDPTTAAASRSA